MARNPQHKIVGVIRDSDATTYAFDVTRGPRHPHLAVRWGGREVLTDQQPIHTNRHFPYTIIKYAIHGQATFRSGDQQWEIRRGMAFWNMAGHDSVLSAPPGQHLASYVVLVFGDEAQPLLDQCLHVPVAATELAHPDEVRSIMEVIMGEGLAPSDHTSEICADLAKVLIRRIDANMQSAIVSHSVARSTYRRCQKYIAANFASITSIAEAAAACGVTLPYLCRLFDLFSDLTAHEYMTRLKLGTAEYLLLKGSTPVKAVAAAVGYDDFRLFSRNFKTLYGQSPRDYRGKHSRRSAGKD